MLSGSPTSIADARNRCHSRPVSPLFLVLLSSAGPAQVEVPEPLESPVLSATLSLRQEANGQCAEIDAGLVGKPPLIRMTDVCHGWSTQSCATILLIKAQGIVEDAAELLFMRENRKVDVVELIDAEIGKVWPGNEHLHLALTGLRCVRGAMTVTFDGSRVSKAGSASAHGITGTAKFLSARRIAMTVTPAR